MTVEARSGHLSYAEIEACMAQIVQVEPARRSALRARLKQWRKMGFPKMKKVGRGARAKYSVDDLMQMTTLVAMLACGITPERAILVLQGHWNTVRLGYAVALDRLAKGIDNEVFIAVRVFAFQEISRGQKESIHLAVVSQEEIARALSKRRDEVLQGTTVIDRISAVTYTVMGHSIMLSTTVLMQEILIALREAAGRDVTDFCEDFDRLQEPSSLKDSVSVTSLAANTSYIEWLCKIAEKVHARSVQGRDIARSITRAL